MAKGQISLIFNNKVVSKICIPNFVCGLTNNKKKNVSNKLFVLSPGLYPRVGLQGTGRVQGVILFKNMVMWHIKLTMRGRTDCK